MPRTRFLNLPIAAQIVALLLAVLVIAQLATLGLSFAFPPTPPPQQSLQDIARALRGEPLVDGGSRPLLRQERSEAPVRSGPGWLVAEVPRNDLARLLNASPEDVRLMFYVPAPTSASPPPSPQMASTRTGSAVQASFLPIFQDGPPPGPPPGDFGPPRDIPPPGDRPGDAPGQRDPRPQRQSDQDSGRQQRQPPVTGTRIQRPDRGYGGQGNRATGDQRGTPPASQTPPPAPQSSPNAPSEPPPPAQAAPPPPAIAPTALAPASLGSSATPSVASPSAVSGASPVRSSVARDRPSPAGTPPVQQAAPRKNSPGSVAIAASDLAPPVAQSGGETAEAVAVASATGAVTGQAQQPTNASAGAVERLVPPTRGLFGSRPPGFVEGDFVAAQRLATGNWVVVEPEPEGFPTAWQKRMLLWFALSFGIVAPIGWIFARRLTAPLRGFAEAAERLGRNPGKPVPVTDGPAEVGRAARAFNDMQTRLSRYVEDRTTMIGAISHDLRTPLARMRFRVEREQSPAHDDYVRDIEQMDAMISSVLAYMREGVEAQPRQRIDLRSLLEVAVDDAVSVGGDVELEPGDVAEVEVDVIGFQRVFANLLDNALKYGGKAKVWLKTEGAEVVAGVSDSGPGLSEEELESVFRPFARSTSTAHIQGYGLGLATSRSIVRAHGGDMRLRTGDGLTAEVRLPVAA